MAEEVGPPGRAGPAAESREAYKTRVFRLSDGKAYLVTFLDEGCLSLEGAKIRELVRGGKPHLLTPLEELAKEEKREVGEALRLTVGEKGAISLADKPIYYVTKPITWLPGPRASLISELTVIHKAGKEEKERKEG